LATICFRLESNRDLVNAVRAPRGGKIIDVGCGSGKGLVQNLAWIRDSGHLIASDPDPTALDFMQRVADRYGVIHQVSFACLPAQDVRTLGYEQFDGAYAHFSMDKIGSHLLRSEAFESVASTLKPGARFAVAVPSLQFNRRALAAYIRRAEAARTDLSWIVKGLRGRIISALTLYFNRKVDANFTAGIFHRYSKEELIDYFERAGFGEVEIRHIDGMNAFHAVGVKR
jgi:ubiquinone/menaquinone biosynthesis C-methylase UbiE